MHSTDLKHQFVTLRARGLALGKIAEQLNIPKSTLGRWQAECEEEIQQLQRIRWEEIEEQYGYTLQDDLKRIMKRLRAAEDQLDARSLERFSRRELFQLIRESRREYEKKRALLLGTPKRDKMVRPPASTKTVSLEGGAPRRHDQPSALNASASPPDIAPNHNPPLNLAAPSRPSASKAESHSNAAFDLHEKPIDVRMLSPLPRAVETQSLAAHGTGLGQGEGQTSSSSAAVKPENPAKTLPFPCQNSGGHNSNLSVQTAAPEPDLRNTGSFVIGNSGSTPHFLPRLAEHRRAAAPSAGSSADAPSVEAENPA